jgi:Peptidase family M49
MTHMTVKRPVIGTAVLMQNAAAKQVWNSAARQARQGASCGEVTRARAAAVAAISLALLFAACSTEAPATQASPAPAAPSAPSALAQKTARFAPTDITADLSTASPGDRAVLAKLVAASKVIDALFLRQVWAGNEAMLADLVRDQSPAGRDRLHAFLVNKGPWSRLDHFEPFVPGAPPKPAGANFYPADATREEIDAWIKRLPEAERARSTGFFTTIRRGQDRRLAAVSYSLEYQNELMLAAALLREAATLASEPTLKTFLSTRADALLSNDYYASDVAWMELKGAIEPTFGPYEVYEDEYFNYKAAFEAFITLRDEAETAKLQKFAGDLQDIENHLPIDPARRNPKLGALAPIVVVNEIFAAGDANRGVQTAAYNLPNDERVTREKGAKRVMLKNVQDAKFAKTLVPISKIVLAPGDASDVSFDAFFTHIVMHELMHGLGPHTITVNGRQTTVRQEMKDASSFLEEAKADISGLWALQYLIDKGVIEKSFEQKIYTTFLASSFRSIRFGVAEAHGKGVALQLNYLLDQGGFVLRPDGTVAVDRDKIKAGVAALSTEIMNIQADGDYAKAVAFGQRLGVVRPPVQALLDKLADVPVDIEPRFTTAEELIR